MKSDSRSGAPLEGRSPSTRNVEDMVIAARRAYSDTLRWIKDARPRGSRSGRLALRLFRALYVGALVLLGLIGLVRPSRFGAPTSRPLRSAEWAALALLVAVLGIYLFLRRRDIRASSARFLEPFRRPIDHPSYDPAASALGSCPAAFRTRFALGWVWGPAAAFLLAALLAAASAYFVVDAILAGFDIGWQQPVLALIQAALSLVVLRAAATRLATWRLALSVHRTVTGGYV